MLNDPEVINAKGGTFYRSNLRATLVIDLTFYMGFKKTKWLDWNYLDHSGLDHKVIVFQGIDNQLLQPTSTLMPPFFFHYAYATNLVIMR